MNILDSPIVSWEDEDMEWVQPQYGKAKIDWAGHVLIAATASGDEKHEAFRIINNWRAAHAFPLNTLRQGLYYRAGTVDSQRLIAQRIKRLESIFFKLRRFPTMELSQMQDIGGCRAVVSTVAKVRELHHLHLDSGMKHALVRTKDYIEKPRDSGYRSIHLIYQYKSDKKPTYDGHQIEVQLRSKLQHAWATAVETVGTFVQQSLKASRGSGEWLRFFALMGAVIAQREHTPPVPGTPTLRTELVRELRDHIGRLDVMRGLTGYRTALQTFRAPELKDAHFFLLELRPAEGRLKVTGFSRAALEKAMEEYLKAEQSLQGSPGAEAVLVSVESVDALQRAYPNYFLDTAYFLQVVQEAVK
jgi:hypothetical protein